MEMPEPPKIDRTNNYYISRALFEDYQRMYTSRGKMAEQDRIIKLLENEYQTLQNVIIHKESDSIPSLEQLIKLIRN